MLVTGTIIDRWRMIAWMCAVSVIGVLLEFPTKRRFIWLEKGARLAFP